MVITLSKNYCPRAQNNSFYQKLLKGSSQGQIWQPFWILRNFSLHHRNSHIKLPTGTKNSAFDSNLPKKVISRSNTADISILHKFSWHHRNRHIKFAISSYLQRHKISSFDSNLPKK